MSNFIERIQSWPESKRKKLLVISTTLITLIILVVWFSTFNSDFLSLNDNLDESKTNNIASPIGAISNAVSGFLADLNSDLADLKGNFGF